MNYLFFIFFSVFFYYAAVISQYILKNNTLPNFIVSDFSIKLYFFILLILSIDFLIFQILLKKINVSFNKISAIVYSPILLFLSYKFVYGRLKFLNRTINDPLKEIKYLIGLIIISILFFKLLFFVKQIFLLLKKRNILNKNFQILIFCIFVYLFVPAGLYKYWFGSVGDEKEYVINIYSLAVDGNLNLVDDIKNIQVITGGSELPPPLNFYTEKIYSLHSNLIPFHLLILPSYILLGRFGLIVFFTIISGLIFLYIYKIIFYLEANQLSAFSYSIFSACLAFFIIYNYQIYPEIIAAFFNIYFIWLLLKNYERKIYYFVLLTSPLMHWFNLRYIFFGAAYIVIYLFKYQLKKMLSYKNLCIYFLFAISVFLFLLVNYLMYESFSFSANTLNYEMRYVSEKFYITLLGILFDSHYGILAYMPLLIFCIYDIILKFKKNYASLIILIFYLAPLSFYSGNWFGGFSPPMRLAAPIIPLIILGGSEFFKFFYRSTISKLLVFILLIYSIFMSIMLYSVPILMYNERNNGNNQIFEKIYWFFKIDINRYFATFVPHRINSNSYKLVVIYFFILLIIYLIINIEGIRKCQKK
ncbi:MAG TPA: hypothetical protein PLM75_04175 [bacterium]|nr:hypothetical protein [bacterium]